MWCLASACAVILAGLLAPAAGAAPNIRIHWSGTPAPNQDVAFTAGDGGGTYTSWAWDLNNDGQFGDQTGQTVINSYRNTGDFAIAVIASNELGESDLAEDVVKVREPSGTKMPEASFVFFPTAPLAGEAVTFVSTSTDPDSPIPAGALRWDLDGDGLFDDATGPSVAVSFPVAATYLIALQVTTNAKDVATLALPVGMPAGVLAQRSFSLMSPFPVVRIVGRASKRGARIRRLSIDAPPGTCSQRALSGAGMSVQAGEADDLNARPCRQPPCHARHALPAARGTHVASGRDPEDRRDPKRRDRQVHPLQDQEEQVSDAS